MLVQSGLCRTSSKTTLLVFPRGGSSFVSLQHNNLNIDSPADNGASAIPVGYAAVSLRPEANVPSHLLHGNYLVPRFIKRDLYSKIKTALEDSGLAYEGKMLISAQFKALQMKASKSSYSLRLGRENILPLVY